MNFKVVFNFQISEEWKEVSKEDIETYKEEADRMNFENIKKLPELTGSGKIWKKIAHRNSQINIYNTLITLRIKIFPKMVK